MTRRVLALVGYIFYGALDRFTGTFFRELSYPIDDDLSQVGDCKVNPG